MKSRNWPSLVGPERARFRDECDGSGRLVVADRADGRPGAVLVMPEDGERGEVYVLTNYDVDGLIAALRTNAGATAISTCHWCDSLGMVDGDDGPMFCEHASRHDSAGPSRL